MLHVARVSRDKAAMLAGLHVILPSLGCLAGRSAQTSFHPFCYSGSRHAGSKDGERERESAREGERERKRERVREERAREGKGKQEMSIVVSLRTRLACPEDCRAQAPYAPAVQIRPGFCAH